MKVLIIGATGVMGAPLVEQLLAKGGYEIHATSRSFHQDTQVTWHQLNAHDMNALEVLLREGRFDCIVDFMAYTTAEFRERIELLLSNTLQYFFLSSSRIYAPCEGIISEDSPKLLDVCEDRGYLKTDEYALAKYRQEKQLNDSGRTNYTIIRPSLTYGYNRLQFALWELREWAFRVQVGNSIILPSEMKNIITTMTSGTDAARIISKLIGNNKAYGEIFNVSGGGSLTWESVLDIYSRAVEDSLGRKLHVAETGNAAEIAKALGRYDQYRFARGVSRIFSNAKVESIIDGIDWVQPENGLYECAFHFFSSGVRLKATNCRQMALLDSLTNEHTPIRYFSNVKQWLGYTVLRSGLLK